MMAYLYGKRFGSKIAWVNMEEDDRVVAGPDLLASYWLRLFSIQTFSHINTPSFSNLVIFHTYPPTKMEKSVPKRRHIKSRRRGITQKKV